MNFLRIFVLVLVAMVGWAGISVGYHGDGEVGDGGNVVKELALGDSAWAVEPGTGTTTKGATTPDKSSSSLVVVLNALLNVMYALLTPLLLLAGWLLTPDWAFGEIFGLRPVIHDLWILISNIVYIIFAFLLVTMAFMNIFGAEGNTWAIRAKLPKLIVGIISVPFTWFFVSAIVSLSSILTASAIQLAGDLAPTDSSELELSIPKKCTINFEASVSGTAATPAAGGAAAKPGSKFLDCPPSTEKKPFKELFKSSDAFGIVSYYAYGVFKIDKYKEIT
jgi:hypothetical protein